MDKKESPVRMGTHRGTVPDQNVKSERGAMHTFTVEVRLPADLRKRSDARVRAHGGDQSQYVREVLERDLRADAPHPGMTFQELLSLASGPSPADQMTDEELA